MKKLLLFTLIMVMSTGLWAAPRFHVAEVSEFGHGQSPVHGFKGGISYLLSGVGLNGSVYMLNWIAYGDENGLIVRSGGIDFAYFPFSPSGKGLRVFLPVSTEIQAIDPPSEDPVTYWKAASGVGLYWDFNPGAALWVAGKLTGFNNLSGQFGVGLSIAIQ